LLKLNLLAYELLHTARTGAMTDYG